MILTSPPFPLNNKKKYGNLTGEAYLSWFKKLAPLFSKLLTPNGSIVIEMGNAWEPNRPVQSLLTLNALLKFVNSRRAHLRLCQEFICYNPARLPSPAQLNPIKELTDAFFSTSFDPEMILKEKRKKHADSNHSDSQLKLFDS